MGFSHWLRGGFLRMCKSPTMATRQTSRKAIWNRRPRLEILEQRIQPATVYWTGSNGDWDTGSNWSTGTVPGVNDDVQINQSGLTITHSTGTDSVNSITSSANLTLSGGMLNVSTTLQMTAGADLTVQGGTLNNATIIPDTGGSVVALTSSGGPLTGITIAGGVTVDGTASGVTLSVTGGMTLNGTLEVGAANGSTHPEIDFKGSQTLDGSGTVVLGGSANNALYVYVPNDNGAATLTIGSGITIQGGSGIVRGYYNDDGLINDGTINISSGQNLQIGGSNWVNNGTITANGASVSLAGSFTFASLGNFSAVGGTVNLISIGTLNNTGASVNLSPTTGVWYLAGGTINGGTITSTGGSGLALTSSGGTLAGVTIAAGVTMDGTASGVTLSITGGMTLNGTLEVGAANGSTHPEIDFKGSQMLDGSGTVVLGGSANNALYVYVPNDNGAATLTIGSGITIQGGSGIVRGYYNDDGLINDGTINISSGQNLQIGGSNWVNNGTITANGASVSLAGSFTFASLGTFRAVGGTVNLISIGTLNNTGASVILSPTIGAWYLAGGTINGGTITNTGGSGLVLTSSGGTLAGVTIAAGVTMDGTASGVTLSITGGMTLNGTLEVGAANGSTHPEIDFKGSQTLDGSGTVVLGGSANNALYVYVPNDNGAATLTIGSGITIQGGSGIVRGYYNDDSIIFNGTLKGSLNGSTINFGSGGSGRTLTSFTAITANNGATINIPQSLQVNGSSLTTVSANSRLTVAGSLLGTTQGVALFKPQGTITLNGSGTSGAPQLLEAMSADEGSSAAGFTNNFAYGTLILTNNTYVKLVDQSHNSSGSGAEAVYVNSLVVSSGTTLNLNGLNLYVRDAQIVGSVVGGSITQIPNSGPLTIDSPTPGNLSMAGELDDWTFFERAGNTLTVALDPGSGAAGGPISPTLNWAQVQLLDPSNNVLATASSTTSGSVLTLNNVLLPTDGTYTIAVKAASSHSANTGNYVVAAWDVTANKQSLDLNEKTTGSIATPYSVDEWTFSATANTQVQFDLMAESAGGLTFSLTGPGGYTGFSNLTGSSPLITLSNSGPYTLTAQGTGGATGSFLFEMAETSVTPLSLSSPYSGTFAGNGEAQLFMVNLSSPAPVILKLTDPDTSDHVELYAQRGTAPTRETYAYAANGWGSSQSIVIPSAPAGTWWILAYAESVASPPQSFTIEADATPLLVTGVTPAQYGTGAVATLTLNGAGFTPSTTVALVSADGTMTYPASSVAFNTFTQLTATINLAGVPQGTYSVQVSNSSGGSETLANAFTVIAAGQPELQTQLILPAAVGRHITSTFYVKYANTGTVAMPAPILLLESSVPDDLPEFTLNPAVRVSGYWSSSALPQGYSNTVEILASGKVPGILEPGESVTVPVYYAGMQKPWNFSESQFKFDLRVFNTTDTDTVDWSSLQSSLQPAGISDAAWATIFGSVTSQIGNTWGGYVQLLDGEASYLQGLGEDVTDVSKLWGFAVQQADNALSPIGQALASATDDSLAIPGSLSLSFSRVFASTIDGRDNLGPLGYGWSTPWQTSASIASDGTVTITGAEGAQRVFQPDSRTTGVYFSEPGDTGTLMADGHAGYLLTEADGTATDYNANGSLNYIQDTDGNRITAGYTAGKLTSLTASSGQSITIGYNAAGLISTVSDSQGRTTSYTYDSSNQYLVSVTSFNGQTTSYTYNATSGSAAQHALTSIAIPGGTHQYFTYDNEGRLAGTSNDNGSQPQSFTYAQGQVSVTNGTSDTTNLYYNEEGLLVKSIDALGNVTLNTYDSNFNLVKVTNAFGESETYTYNAAGEVTSSTDFLGNTTQFAYTGPFNKLASMTEANGNTTTYAYNSAGDLLSTTYANGTSESFTYNPLGEATSFLNANAQPIQYTYNAAGQMTSEKFSDGSEYTYTYDGAGNMLTATDATGTITFTYDPVTQMLTEVAYPNGTSLSFTYNAAGQRTSMVDQTGFTVNYAYDPVGRLSGLTDGSGNPIVTYTYDPDGRLSLKTNGNGTYTTYQYDADGNVLHLVNYAPGGSVNSRFDYSYNALGLETSEATLDGAWTYTYDADGQLVHAVFASTNPDVPSQDLAYSYDAMGNRITTVINGVNTTYTTNNVNEYTSVGGVAYQYDADGNLLYDGTNTYTYNALNQLVSVVGPSGTTTYTYNALGQRVASTTNGVTTQYLIDPSGIGNVVGQYTSDGSLIADYTYGLGLASQVTTDGSYYYDFDSLRSTVGLSNSTGIYVDSYRYLPFGEIFSSSQTVANPFQFIGSTGIISEGDAMLLMRARNYLPNLGRFAAMDPLGIAAADADLYRYSFNDPVNYVDPLGLFSLSNISVTFGSGGHILGYGGSINASIHPSGPGPLITDDGSNPEGEAGSWFDIGGQIGINWGGESNWSFGWTPKWWEPVGVSISSTGFAVSVGRGVGLPVTNNGNPAASSSGRWCWWQRRHWCRHIRRTPNALIGPAGYGTSNFVALNDAVFPYQIDFENASTATAPAQTVTITDQLDPNLDWSTFQLTVIAWGDTILSIPAGSQHYEATVPMTYNGETFDVQVEAGIHTATGQVYATFQSIDPTTGLPPDVLTGFLPPENGTGRGSGDIQFLTQPNAGLPTGTQIRNVAYVTFDQNGSIATDQVDDEDPSKGHDPNKQALVTIDSGPPSSSVASLPAVSSTTNFTVNWSGNDDTGGSGIGSYTIYVSDNEGPFTPWLSATTETSATFAGQDGHTYGFFSVATDNVGNVQSTPSSAQATTTVDATSPTSSVGDLPAYSLGSFTVSWSGSDSNGIGIASYDIYVSDDGSGFTPWLTDTTQTSATFNGVNGHTYGFYSIATDILGNQQSPPSSAQATTTVDTTPPTVTISDPSQAITASSSVSYTVTYTDDHFGSSTLTASDISLNATGTASGVIGVSGSDTSYTVTISSITGDGTLGISIAADTAVDQAGNEAPAEGPSSTFTVDNTAPTISISAPSQPSTSTGPITYTVIYADTNFDSSDLTTSNVHLVSTGDASGTLSFDSGSGATRTVTISDITGNGSLAISIDAGSAIDEAGNLAPASGDSTSFAVDNTQVGISITDPSKSITNTAGGPITYTVTYTAADFASSDLTTSNVHLLTTGDASGTLSFDSSTGPTRTVSISNITGNGALGISIDAGSASDQTGNVAPAASSTTFIVDNVPPTVSIGQPSRSIINTAGGPVTYTVTYTDTDFASSTLTASNVHLIATGTATGTLSFDNSTGATRTVTVTPTGTGNGQLAISIDAGSRQRSGGQHGACLGDQLLVPAGQHAAQQQRDDPERDHQRLQPRHLHDQLDWRLGQQRRRLDCQLHGVQLRGQRELYCHPQPDQHHADLGHLHRGQRPHLRLLQRRHRPGQQRAADAHGRPGDDTGGHRCADQQRQFAAAAQPAQLHRLVDRPGRHGRLGFEVFRRLLRRPDHGRRLHEVAEPHHGKLRPLQQHDARRHVQLLHRRHGQRRQRSAHAGAGRGTDGDADVREHLADRRGEQHRAAESGHQHAAEGAVHRSRQAHQAGHRRRVHRRQRHLAILDQRHSLDGHDRRLDQQCLAAAADRQGPLLAGAGHVHHGVEQPAQPALRRLGRQPGRRRPACQHYSVGPGHAVQHPGRHDPGQRHGGRQDPRAGLARHQHDVHADSAQRRRRQHRPDGAERLWRRVHVPQRHSRLHCHHRRDRQRHLAVPARQRWQLPGVPEGIREQRAVAGTQRPHQIRAHQQQLCRHGDADGAPRLGRARTPRVSP